jgi:hypothetical protein
MIHVLTYCGLEIQRHRESPPHTTSGAVEDLANDVQNTFNQTLLQWAVRLANTPQKQKIFHLLYACSPCINDAMAFLELQVPNTHDSGSPNDASDIEGLVQLAKIFTWFSDKDRFDEFMWESAPAGLRLDSETWGHVNAMAAVHCINAIISDRSVKLDVRPNR